MARRSTAAAVPVRYPRKALSRKPAATARSIEFPGCYPMRLRRDEIDSHEGRIEYWEADTVKPPACTTSAPASAWPA